MSDAPGRAAGLPSVSPVTPAEAIARSAGVVVLDVRDEDAFGAGHLPGGGNVPRADFKERRAELPPRDAELLVVGASESEAEAAARELAALGFLRVRYLAATPDQVPGGLEDRAPAARLWRPAPFLAEVLPEVMAGLAAHAPAPTEAPRAADLASGAGREAAFLALHGFSVDAWEADPDARRRAEALAARAGVRLTAIACDLEQSVPPLPVERYALVTCFRFLYRPLFPAIARALAPGGFLVYQTYRRGQERYGRPRRARFLLEDGELARAFPDLETLRAEEQSPEGGPVTARLLARRRS